MDTKVAEMLARRYIDVHNTHGADAAQELAARTVGDNDEDKEQVSLHIELILEAVK